MTTSDNISAVEAIEKAMEGVTPGPWSYRVDDSQGGIAYAATILGPNIEDRGHPVVADIPPRTMHGTHAANAAYIAACNPVAMSALLAEARKAEAMKREIAELKADLAELRAFAASFKLTCVESSFYKDCYIHINEPDAIGFRLGNGSQFSKFIARLEDRRARALLNGGSDAQG
ncbi:MAG: hypothetical protein LCH99_04445 [Proteobacteria bacterium]|nr:hypothetical protein [Pseudomonadota bacterium]